MPSATVTVPPLAVPPLGVVLLLLDDDELPQAASAPTAATTTNACPAILAGLNTREPSSSRLAGPLQRPALEQM